MTDTYKPGDKVLIVATVDAANKDDPVQPIRVRIAGELATIWPRAEDIHGPAPAPATGGTVTVRAGVKFGNDGEWDVWGWSKDVPMADNYAAIITADIPLPTTPTITAKVEEGE